MTRRRRTINLDRFELSTYYLQINLEYNDWGIATVRSDGVFRRFQSVGARGFQLTRSTMQVREIAQP